MTIEKIELRKILTQMLADNGINRETIKYFVKEILEEKAQKAVPTVLSQIGVDNLENDVESEIRKFIDNEIAAVVRSLVRDQIKAQFSTIHVKVELKDADDKLKRSISTSI